MKQILAVLLAVVCAGSSAADTIPSLSDDMRAAEIVILGENHDNPAHHLLQAALIEKLSPQAVVFEMLTPEMADQVNNAPNKAVPDLGDRIGWEAAGWPDYAIYQPVFAALGAAHVMGAAAPRETVRAAFEAGAAAVFGAEAGRFGLDTPLAPAQQALREDVQFDAHCQAMPREMMAGMVEAQRLRDAQFSLVALTALKTYGAPVVVITGNGHARRDWGMPFVIGQAAPDVQVHAVGLTDGAGSADDPYDTTFASAGFERPDPCAAFAN